MDNQQETTKFIIFGGILRDYTLDINDEIVQPWLKNQGFKVNNLLTLLIIFLIILIIKVFKINFKMGFYKFTTLSEW